MGEILSKKEEKKLFSLAPPWSKELLGQLWAVTGPPPPVQSRGWAWGVCAHLCVRVHGSVFAGFGPSASWTVISVVICPARLTLV